MKFKKIKMYLASIVTMCLMASVFMVVNVRAVGPLVLSAEVQTSLDEQLFSGIGDLSKVKAAVRSGANINAQNKNKSTPLHEAVYWGDLETVTYLITNGANVHAKDENGYTPIRMFSFVWGDIRILGYLADKGADLRVHYHDGNTPLHLAVYSRRLNVVETLVRRGADLNAKDRNENTALHLAAEIGQLDIVECLVKAGANCMIKNNKGKTVYDIISIKKPSKSIEKLKRMWDYIINLVKHVTKNWGCK